MKRKKKYKSCEPNRKRL